MNSINLANQQFPDTTKDIWEWLYMVSMPAIHVASDYELSLRESIGSTGNKHLDEQVRTEWRTVYRSVEQMVEAYKKGIPISIPSEADTEKIYLSIQAHIENMAQACGRQINVRNFPYEDLIAMEEFAKSIYEYAAPIMANAFRQPLSEELGLADFSMFKDPMLEQTQSQVEERESFSEFFMTKAAQSGMFKPNKG